MRISIGSSELLDALASVKGFASGGTMSILSSVHFKSEDDRVKITATDIKAGASVSVPCIVEEAGEAAINAEKLYSSVSSLPRGDIFIDTDGRVAVVKGTGKAKFKIKMLEGTFPEIEDIEGTRIKLSGETFCRMVQSTAFAVSDDETRYFMCGIYFDAPKFAGGKDGVLQAIATDGRRLSMFKSDVESPEVSAITPTPALLAAAKLIKSKGDVELCFSPKLMSVSFGDHVFWTVLIDGQFPNYQRVIPDSQLFDFSFNREDALRAIKRVAIVTDKASQRIYLTVRPGVLSIDSESSDVGDASDEIPIKYDGVERRIALNHRYLKEALDVTDGDEAAIHFTDPNRALTIEAEPLLQVIMPMQLD
jgi:DNA polymerase-3 subunit beta